MSKLKNSKCDVRKIEDLQFSILDRQYGDSSYSDDDALPTGATGGTRALGNFFQDRTYAWLSCGPRLVVFSVANGKSVRSWTFRDRITCVEEFPTQQGQIPLLLVGLDNGATKARDSSGLICVFDCSAWQVLWAIRMPAGVELACIITGGAEWEDYGDKRVENALGDSCSGIVCVALRNLDHLMIDLKRSSWKSTEGRTPVDESNPAELDFTTHDGKHLSRNERRSVREKHAAYNLMNSRLEKYIGFNREEFENSALFGESLTSALICSRKIGCLVSGCLGRIIIWQTNGDVRWISPASEDALAVTHLALLEPTDDPRPFCYLWAAHEDERKIAVPFLRMYAMLFERKYSDKGANTYYNLESDPSLKFSLELEPWTSITNLCPIVRESSPELTDSVYKRDEDSILLICSDKRVLLFDLNQWYKEQMPHNLSECTNPNAILASYFTRPNDDEPDGETVISSAYINESLKEFPSSLASPSEELYYPNSLSFDWIELTVGQTIVWTSRGLQEDLLREIAQSGPAIMLEPTEIYENCLAAGLIPTSGEFSSPRKIDKEAQRDALLSLCLEQLWSRFLLRCANEWSDGSASLMFHAFIRWAMQRASSLKLMADQLSIPLYDQSGTSLGNAEIRSLRFYSQQLDCICNVLSNLTVENVDLSRERRILHRVTSYLQVLLWFYDVGLLPECQEEREDEAAKISLSFSLGIPYPYEKLARLYREKREELARGSTKNASKDEEDLFIDELIGRQCAPLRAQWEREGQGESSVGGFYPPSSLQLLLRSYLTDCHGNFEGNEMETKHQITIYFLMDLAMLLQNSCPAVDQLIKYPGAFKLSPSLIKLTQALWLLDHEDYQGSFNMLTGGELVSDSEVKDWHHKLVLRALMRNNQNKLALDYLKVRKPPLSSLEDQEIVIDLSVERGLVKTAFHRRPASHYSQLLMSFFRACKIHNKLSDILHLSLEPEEEQAFVKFLENEKIDHLRLLYYLQRCRYAEAGRNLPGNLWKNDKNPSQTIVQAYTATLPQITRKLSTNINRRISDSDPATRYPRPMSHSNNRAGTGRDIYEIAMKTARETFLRTDRRGRIPFLSAPCAAIAAQDRSVEVHSGLFVQRKTHGKRKFETVPEEIEESRKKRKTSIEEDNDSEYSAGMGFDTPLVKRKRQIVNDRSDVPSKPEDTPQSILKIRQMIRDSRSPSLGRDFKPTSRQPRQIRFSIATQVAEPSPERESSLKNNEEDVSMSGSETTNEKAEISEEEVDSEPEIQVGANYRRSSSLEKSCHEPNVTASGPRPRPGLRRSVEMSPGDLWKKSLIRSTKKRAILTSKDSPAAGREVQESPKITSTVSIESVTMSETMYENTILSSGTSFEGTLPPICTPTASKSSFFEDQTSVREKSASRDLDDSMVAPSALMKSVEMSESVYDNSILSSDTSVEQTLPPICTPKASKSSFFENQTSSSRLSFDEKSMEKCRDLSSMVDPRDNEIILNFGQSLINRTSTRLSDTELAGNPEEMEKNSETLMVVDRFGLDSEISSNISPKNQWETVNEPDKPEVTEVTEIQSISETIKDTGRESDSEGEEEEEEKEGEEKTSEEGQSEEDDSESPLNISLKLQEEDEEVEDSLKTDETENQNKEEAPIDVENDFEIQEHIEIKKDEKDDLGKVEASQETENEIEIEEIDESKVSEDGQDDIRPNAEENVDDDDQDDDSQVIGEIIEAIPEYVINEVEDRVEIEEIQEEVQEIFSNCERQEIVEDRMEYAEAIEIREISGSEEISGSGDIVLIENPNSNTNYTDEMVDQMENEEHKSEDTSDEDDEDDVYQSLTNSLEIQSVAIELPQEKSSKEIGEEESDKKSENALETMKNGISEAEKSSNVHEYSITDDESSKDSVSSAITTSRSSKSGKNELDSTISIDKVNFDDASNITNDNSSSSSSDSLLFTVKKSRKVTEKKVLSTVEEAPNDYDSSQDWRLFSHRKSAAPSGAKGKTDSSERSSDTLPLSRDTSKMSHDTTDEIVIDEPKVEKTPEKLEKSRKQEPSPVPEAPQTRLRMTRSRRAGSQAKDILTSKEEKLALEEETKSPNISRILRGKRSKSVAKESEVAEEIAEITEEPKEAIPIGRRTRRATSLQKEIIAKPKITRSSSKVSLSETSVGEPASEGKPTRRKRTDSTSSESEKSMPKRFTRASSLAKEVPEVEIPSPRATRKRASSVPNEFVSTGVRTRRGGSVAKEIIVEESPEEVDEKPKANTRSRSTRGASKEKNTGEKEKLRPTTTTTTTRGKNRLLAIDPIAEVAEVDVINVEESDDEIFSVKPRTQQKKVDIKRRTRSAATKNASTVEENLVEEAPETTPDDSKISTRKKAPPRRKRTTSATTDMGPRVVVAKLSPTIDGQLPLTTDKETRGHHTYQFSPPAATRHHPDVNEKESEEVPNYVFSPPHTRSKEPPTRRKINDFLPLTEEEKADAEKRILEDFVPRRRITLPGPTRDPLQVYGPLKQFALPRRVKSTTDEPEPPDQGENAGGV